MAEAPNKSARWTDTDDAVVLTFQPAEAAEILGRTLSAVYSRRSSRDVVSRQHRDRKPRKRLRRDFFCDGRGEREEVIPARPSPQCRYCPRVARGRGLCKSCHDRVLWLVRMGYVSQEIVEQCWLSPRRNAT